MSGVERTTRGVCWTCALGLTLSSVAVQADEVQRSVDADASQIQEIVVSGQRRAERIQDAAVAVSAFTADALENANVSRPGDVLKLTPNVTFVQSNHPGEFFVTIRGNTQTRLGENSVALVVDGVQVLDQNSINQELFDIEQLEVLKGPQGALYGRNAIGGAIVIQTRRPDFDEWQGKVKLGAANGTQRTGQASLSGPLTDKFAIRTGVSYLDRDGFYRNHLTGEEVDRFRDRTGFFRAMWLVSDKVTGDFRLSATDMDGGGINWVAILALPPELGGNAEVLSGDDTSLPWVNNIRGFSRNSRRTMSMKWDIDFSHATLVSTTSHAKLKDDYGSDSYPYFYDPGQFYVLFPGDTPIGLGAQTQELRRDAEILTQELRLQSQEGAALRWMIGAYYAEFDIDNVSTTGADTHNVLLGLGPHPYGSQNQTLSYLNDTNDNEAVAAFANLGYELGPLEVMASVRWDKEKKRQTDRAFPGAPDPADPKQIPTWRIEAWRSRSTEFSQVQPKLSVRYRITPDVTAYTSWGRGFKTGGFNPFGTAELLRQFNPASTVEDIFPKEVADTWEVGLKTKWLGRRLSVNVAYFDTKSEHAQALEFFPQAGLQAISTADEVDMKGVEIDVQARPFPGLDLMASYGYLDTEITRFDSNPAYVGNRRPSNSPYTWLIGAQYTTALGGAGWELVARADYTREGTTTWDWAETPGAARSPYEVVNARIALKNDAWEIAAWSKNLTDEKYNAEHIVLLPYAGALFRAAPRQYGLDVSYRF